MFLRFLNIQGIVGLAVSAVLATLLLLQHGETRHWKKQSGQFEQLYSGEKIAHQKTIINYQNAAAKARQLDAENKARVEREQRVATEKREAEYEARIADARARADRLRRQDPRTGAHQGGPGTAGLPGVPNAPGGPAPGAPQDRLPAGDALIATEQAIQLDELIRWVKDQTRIDYDGNNGGASAVTSGRHP
jgi:hypothetical protein